jgi:hypothetical protein
MTTTKFSDTIDFSPGLVVYEEFSLNEKAEWIDDVDNLNEDLLQVTFPGNIFLDIGWYPAQTARGQFQVRVIRDMDWDNPVFYAEVASLGVLRSVLEAARRTAVETALVAV